MSNSPGVRVFGEGFISVIKILFSGGFCADPGLNCGGRFVGNDKISDLNVGGGGLNLGGDNVSSGVRGVSSTDDDNSGIGGGPGAPDLEYEGGDGPPCFRLSLRDLIFFCFRVFLEIMIWTSSFVLVPPSLNCIILSFAAIADWASTTETWDSECLTDNGDDDKNDSDR